jgi:peptidoglycan/LPS O-acetylase OafA/YrhL
MTSSVQKTFHENHKYIRGIDGLRALAVLAVLLFHLASTFLPGGFSGVDVFFVISGYVISASLARDSNSNLFHFITSFYARRIIRIFPALIVCLVVASIVTTLFVPASWLSSTSSRTGLFAFFGLSNFALVWFNDGYFAPRVEFNSFTHTWSLGVEEQFYAVFPLIMFVWLKYKEKKNIWGSLVNWLLAILLMISFLYSCYETSASPDKAFYLLPSRFWELACGALLFKLHSRQKLIPTAAIKQRFCLLAGIILVGLGFILSDKRSFPFPWAILSVGGTVLLIAGLLNRSDRKPTIQNLLESSVFVYIGKISYSLYLWHWPVYVLLRWTLGLETAFEKGLAITLTFALAHVSYKFVEKPIRQNKYSIGRPNWQVISVGITAIVISFCFVQVVFKSQSVMSLSVTKDKKIWYPYEWPEAVTNEKQKIFVGRKLFVLGDSHAGAYSTMLQKLSDEYGVKIVKLSAGGCGVASLLKPVMNQGDKCSENIEKEISTMEASASPGDILFLASLRMNRFGDEWALFPEKDVIDAQFSEKSSSDRERALEETKELIRRFEKLEVHIVIDAPLPIFKSPPFRCSDWFNKSNPVCLSGFTMRRDALLNDRKPVMKSLDLLVSDFPKLIIWDPFPILCKTNICSAFEQNKPLFFDDDHLSAYGNRVPYSSFKSLVKKIWLPNRDNRRSYKAQPRRA